MSGLIARDPKAAVARVSAMIGYSHDAALESLATANDTLRRLGEKRARLVAEMAPLKARFYGGSATPYDHARKAYLSVRAEQLRDEARAGGGKEPSQTALDSMAHGDDAYVAWLQQQEQQRVRFYGLEADLVAVDAEIEAAERERGYAIEVLRIISDLTRALSAEARVA